MLRTLRTVAAKLWASMVMPPEEPIEVLGPQVIHLSTEEVVALDYVGNDRYSICGCKGTPRVGDCIVVGHKRYRVLHITEDMEGYWRAVSRCEFNLGALR